MIKKIKMEVEVWQDAKIICDICKKEYDADENWDEVQEFHHINFTGGYNSIFGDGTRVECDICQYCLKNMIEKYATLSEDDYVVHYNREDEKE